MNALSSDGSAVGSRSYVLTRVIDDINLTDSLQWLVTASCEQVGNGWASSVTVVADRRPTTMAASDHTAIALDDVQYAASVGPCLTCARAEEVIRIDDFETDRRWPDLRRAAREHGVTSSLSVPLLLAEDDVFGAFNVYGDRPHGFSADDEALVADFAAHAAVVFSNVIGYWQAFDRVGDLTAAVKHRGIIEQAKGVLMAAEQVTSQEAFSLLRQRSRTANRKLHDLALDIVNAIQLVHAVDTAGLAREPRKGRDGQLTLGTTRPGVASTTSSLPSSQRSAYDE